MLQRGQICSARPAASRAAIPVPGMRTSTIMRYRDGEEVRFGRDGPLHVSPAVQLPAIAPLLLLVHSLARTAQCTPGVQKAFDDP